MNHDSSGLKSKQFIHIVAKCVAMLPIVVVLWWFCIHHAALNLLFVANFDVALGHDGFRRLCIALHTRLVLLVVLVACVFLLYLLCLMCRNPNLPRQDIAELSYY
jgi:hypothetical protein